MSTEANNPKAPTPRRLWLGRGESSIASVGLAVTVILIVSLLGCGYWMLRTQRDTLEDARRQQVRLLIDVLGQATEQLLADDELTAVRRLVMEAAARHQLAACRVVTPAGDVLADGDTARITADLDRAVFASDAPAERFEAGGDRIAVVRPLMVAGRGFAQLEVEAPLPDGGEGAWEAQAGVGAISATAMFALLVVYRQFRRRMQALGVIREALLDAQRGEASEAALLVSSEMGKEAEAWNRLLSEQQRLRRLAAVQELNPAAGPAAGDSDLASGCDAITQGLVMIDDSLRIRYANNAAALFLRQGNESLIGQSIESLISDADLLASLRSAVESHKRTTHLVDRRGSGDDTAGVLRYSIRPVRRGDASTAMLVIEDVTQQRVAEEARHDFVAHATHELRTPLTNVRLYLETLIDDGENDPEIRANCLNVINQETRRLERMVTDLLSVAEIEAGSMRVQRDDVRIDELLKDVEHDYQAQAAEKSIQLTFKLPPKLPVLQADRDKLAVAIQNVVGNALKYTPANGSVTVTVDVVGSVLTIEVADTGIGIAPENQAKVFEKFYRAEDKRVAQVTGSGLGLALAREVVRLHGGDITLDSQLDHGSTFTISLPVQGETN